MGPNDPFSSSTASAPPQDAPSPTGAPQPGPPPGRTRVEARLPDPPQALGAGRRAALAGALAGLALGVVAVTVGFGAAVLVALFTAVGAALGAVVRSAFAGGVDVAAAWRALRRQ